MPQVRTKSVPIRRNSQYQKRLSSILKAAAQAITKHGFEGTSVRRVAAKARIGLSGIYYYFHSKEALLFSLQEHTFSTLVASLKERLSSARTPEEKLQAVIDNHLQFFINNRDELKVCVHEIESLSGRYYRRVLQIRREYYALVKQVVREVQGRNTALDPNLTALFLFGSLNWIYMWYDPGKNADIRELSQQLRQIYHHGIAAS